MVRTVLKQKRHEMLAEKIRQNPFLKDEDLARELNVSVATIRFDRAELGIKEYRERIKNVAENGMDGIEKRSAAELLDLNVLHDGISVLEADKTMAFAGTDIIKGQKIFAFAEDLAVGVIGASAAFVKVANVKYIREVNVGDKLVAKSEVKRIRDNEYIVWVRITRQMTEVFRAKFNLVMPETKS